MSESHERDWTQGPARFVAACALGLAGLSGLAWTVMNGAPPRSGAVPPPVTNVVESAPSRLDQTVKPDLPVNNSESGSDPPGAEPEAVSNASDADSPASLARVIDINTATPAQLEQLPRIGPTLAQRIVEDRDENGLFRSLDDLTRVRGIGDKTVAGLRGLAVAR